MAIFFWYIFTWWFSPKKLLKELLQNKDRVKRKDIVFVFISIVAIQLIMIFLTRFENRSLADKIIGFILTLPFGLMGMLMMMAILSIISTWIIKLFSRKKVELWDSELIWAFFLTNLSLILNNIYFIEKSILGLRHSYISGVLLWYLIYFTFYAFRIIVRMDVSLTLEETKVPELQKKGIKPIFGPLYVYFKVLLILSVLTLVGTIIMLWINKNISFPIIVCTTLIILVGGSACVAEELIKKRIEKDKKE